MDENINSKNNKIYNLLLCKSNVLPSMYVTNNRKLQIIVVELHIKN